MTPPVTTATPSLGRRVIVGALGLLAVLLVLLGVTTDLLVGAQARRDLHDRVTASVARADALAAAETPPAQIAAQINGGGIRARLIAADGTTFGDPAIPTDLPPGEAEPPAPPPPPRPPPGGPAPPRPPPPPRDATATAISHALPNGGRVILVADTTSTTALLQQLRITMVASGIVVLLIAAIGLALVVRAAMTPCAA